MSKDVLSATLRNARALPGGEPTIALEFVLKNSSPRPLKLAEHWNSWGAYQWTIELTDVRGRKYRFVNPQQEWCRNYLSVFEISPGGSQVTRCKLFRGNIPREEAIKSAVPKAKDSLNVFRCAPQPEPWTYPVRLVGVFEAHAVKMRNGAETNWGGKIKTQPITLQRLS